MDHTLGVKRENQNFEEGINKNMKDEVKVVNNRLVRVR